MGTDVPLLNVLGSFGFKDWKARKNGTEWFGACPFHETKHNVTCFSFDIEGRYHCFSCGRKGKGAVSLTMVLKGCNYREAIAYLTTLTPTQARQPTRPVASKDREATVENPLFSGGSYAKFKVESEWLENRGIPVDILEKYGVFHYRNDARKSVYNDRIFIPMRRPDGNLVGYLCRATQAHQEPKYLIGKGVLKSLEVFGSHEILQSLLVGGRFAEAKLKHAFLLESPFAVMKFASLNLPAVSCYGWSVSEAQAQILQRLSRAWVFLPDSDKRHDAIQQVCHQLSAMWLKCPEFPGQDPEKLSEAQIRGLL